LREALAMKQTRPQAQIFAIFATVVWIAAPKPARNDGFVGQKTQLTNPTAMKMRIK